MTDYSNLSDADIVALGFREHDVTYRRYIVNALFNAGLIESKEATDPQILDALEEVPTRRLLLISALNSLRFRETFITELGHARDRIRRKDTEGIINA